MAALVITAPLSGWAAPLDMVPDPVFAEGLMGDGVAIEPLDDTLVAPCDGEVTTFHASGHAVALKSAEGAEILIHVGVDTVALKGRGFTPLVKVGQKVARGEPLLRFDMDAVALAAPSLATPIVVANADGYVVERRVTGQLVAAGEELMTLVPAGNAAVTGGGGEWLAARVTLALPHGIHARPAARLAACARGFEAELRLTHCGRQGDVRSTVSLLALGTGCGDDLLVEARGPQAEAALAAIVALLESGMGEAHGGTVPSTPAVPQAGEGELVGVCASPGLAAGRATRLRSASVLAVEEGRGVEVERAALQQARDQVRGRIEAAAQAQSETVASVLRAHLALVDDPALVSAAEAGVASNQSAGMAWRAATRAQAEALRATGNAHLIERIDDLVDVERQLLGALGGASEEAFVLDKSMILIADDLLPSQLVGFAGAPPGGICLARGGPTSHVAILCASLSIPALVAIGEGLGAVEEGTELVLDAGAGRLRVAPSASESEAFALRVAEGKARREAARLAAAEPCRMRDGTRIEVCANVGSVEEARTAAEQGAEGSGLVRSEFLFLDRATAPSEEEQRQAYQGIADALAGKPVIVRLLDIGGDKPAPYIPAAAEENPALGQRGIRLGLARRDLLDTQLSAILGVCPAGQCRVMVPMVASLAEIREVRAAADRARAALGISEPVEIGIMVETPAAAVTADLLAEEADFLSIGTNDLSQYALAMDRGNPAVAADVDAMHPAVLRLIDQTCRLSRAKGRWIGVCGGLASDPAALPILVGLGVTELSCVPGFVGEAKRIVRQLAMEQARELADRALACTSAGEVRALARTFANGEQG